MTDAQTRRAEQADQYASQAYTGERLPIPPSPKDTSIAPPTIDRWRRFIGWFRSLFRSLRYPCSPPDDELQFGML